MPSPPSTKSAGGPASSSPGPIPDGDKFVFEVEGRAIECRRSVLLQQSPYLRDFLGGIRCSKIAIKNVSYEACKVVLDWMHTDDPIHEVVPDTPNLDFSKLHKIWELSLRFTAVTMVRWCCALLESRLTESNVCSLISTTYRYPALPENVFSVNDGFRKRCFVFLWRHMDAIRKTPSFFAMMSVNQKIKHDVEALTASGGVWAGGSTAATPAEQQQQQQTPGNGGAPPTAHSASPQQGMLPTPYSSTPREPSDPRNTPQPKQGSGGGGGGGRSSSSNASLPQRAPAGGDAASHQGSSHRGTAALLSTLREQPRQPVPQPQISTPSGGSAEGGEAAPAPPPPPPPPPPQPPLHRTPSAAALRGSGGGSPSPSTSEGSQGVLQDTVPAGRSAAAAATPLQQQQQQQAPRGGGSTPSSEVYDPVYEPSAVFSQAYGGGKGAPPGHPGHSSSGTPTCDAVGSRSPTPQPPVSVSRGLQDVALAVDHLSSYIHGSEGGLVLPPGARLATCIEAHAQRKALRDLMDSIDGGFLASFLLEDGKVDGPGFGVPLRFTTGDFADLCEMVVLVKTGADAQQRTAGSSSGLPPPLPASTGHRGASQPEMFSSEGGHRQQQQQQQQQQQHSAAHRSRSTGAASSTGGLRGAVVPRSSSSGGGGGVSRVSDSGGALLGMDYDTERASLMLKQYILQQEVRVLTHEMELFKNDFLDWESSIEESNALRGVEEERLKQRIVQQKRQLIASLYREVMHRQHPGGADASASPDNARLREALQSAYSSVDDTNETIGSDVPSFMFAGGGSTTDEDRYIAEKVQQEREALLQRKAELEEPTQSEEEVRLSAEIDRLQADLKKQANVKGLIKTELSENDQYEEYSKRYVCAVKTAEQEITSLLMKPDPTTGLHDVLRGISQEKLAHEGEAAHLDEATKHLASRISSETTHIKHIRAFLDETEQRELPSRLLS